MDITVWDWVFGSLNTKVEARPWVFIVTAVGWEMQKVANAVPNMGVGVCVAKNNLRNVTFISVDISAF